MVASRMPLYRKRTFTGKAQCIDCAQMRPLLQPNLYPRRPSSTRRYFGVLFFIKDLLGRPVGLVTDRALRAQLRPGVEQSLIHVRRPRT
jgi:hypothetical protein